MTQKTKSLKNLITANKDILRPLQSVQIPLYSRQGSDESRVYSADHNGGLHSILSKTISDSGTVKYIVRWENGQQTMTRPSKLRNFYTTVEQYEIEHFDLEDSRQPSPVISNLTIGYLSDSKDDDDDLYCPIKTSIRKRPKRKTKDMVKNYSFKPLDEPLLPENNNPIADPLTVSVSLSTVKKECHHGSHPTVPIVIQESSPTPSPLSSPQTI